MPVGYLVMPALVAACTLAALAPRMAEHLRKGRSPVVSCELPGAQHAFDLFRSVRFEAVLDGVEEFLHWLLRTRLDSGRVR